MRYLLILSCLCAVSSGATLVVGVGGDYGTIQPAIDAAADGDTVLVKPGEYVITVPITFRGKALALRGEAGADATVIRMAATPADANRASVVVFESGETVASVIEGFTLRGGRGGTGAGSPYRYGGGILCVRSSPSVMQCTLLGNWGVDYGGGIHCSDSSPMLTNCTISGNDAYQGGGVCCAGLDSRPTMTSCTISGNKGRSGVFSLEGSSPTLTNCTISGHSGPGVYCLSSSSPTLVGCWISGNHSASTGGGVCCEGSSPALVGCTVAGNWGDRGGGVYCDGSSPSLLNCTISGNCALAGGGVYCIGASSATLRSTIVWGNSGASLVTSEDSPPDVTFCCLETEDVWPGEGNINSDPLFCGFSGPGEVFVDAESAEGGDGTADRPFPDLATALQFSLSLMREISPCIGTGSDGVNMGAELGTCDVAEPSERVLRVAPGRYSLAGVSLAHGASILGEGASETVLEGTVWGLRTGVTLAGVTVTGATSGGIVVAWGDSPSIEECTISGNSGTYGGGVYCYGSSPTLTNCMISGNERGAGVYCSNSSPTLMNCTISENLAKNSSAVYCSRSSPILTNCKITGNTGGGVYCRFDSSPTLTNCTISGHSGPGVECYTSSPTLTACTISGNAGRGVYCSTSSPTLTNCTISGNTGGGVDCRNSYPTLTNCVISRNFGVFGGGIYCESSYPTLTSCTIEGNSAEQLGGGVYCCEGSFPILRSCIVWGNVGGSCVISDGLSLPDVTFCCLETEEVWPGEGNINSDPLFCGFSGPGELFVDAESAEGGDGTEDRPFRDLATALEYSLSLKENSPCIETGKGGADMGADLGYCEPGEPSGQAVVRLSPGRYTLEGLTLAHGVSIVGQWASETVLEGTVFGLRTGAMLSHVTVTGGSWGGLLIGAGESPSVEDCTIAGNRWNGGVYCGLHSSPTLTGCTISGNYGGGVNCWSSAPTLVACIISGNLGIYGGGVCCREGSSPTLTNCTIAGNSPSGLSCFETSSPTLTNCTISWNSHSGVYCSNSGSSPTLTNCAISWNSHSGVYCDLDSSPTLTGCMISGNSGWDGGGVCCGLHSSPTLTGCTISGNSAVNVNGGGGGVYCSWSCSPTLVDCTISGNSAGYGGGVYCSGSNATLTNCTISGNSGWDGGGVYCQGNSSPHLRNCIVWGNTPESVCGELSQCLTDHDPLFVHNGVFNFARFVPVVIGGTTYSLPDFIVVPPDYHLQPGSPAIDAGTCDGAPATDIEGTARPQGAGCDIGAYEYPAPLVVAFTRGDGNRDGLLNIADAVFVLQYLFAGGGELGCPDALDGNDDGKLEIADAIAVLQHLFAQAGPLAAPFGACGADPTEDGLDCASYPPCE